MHVLHFGNVAQNGYNNAKFLRRIGIAADAVCDETQALAQPEWEDAELPPGVAGMDRWSGIEPVDGWRRPNWVIAPSVSGKVIPGQRRLAQLTSLAASYPRLRRLEDELEREGHGLERGDLVQAFRAAWTQSVGLGDLASLFRRYDVVQAYSTHAVLPVVLTSERPFVAFEHGTLRELPFEDSWRGRMLSTAYRRAAKVIITNADVIGSARRLGLENTTFIPHPVDESKYTHGQSALGDDLRREGFDHVLLAPARQDWREKRNDVLVRALGELVRGSASHPLLLLGEWGADRERTRALVAELRLEPNVRWLEPVPKLQLIELYRAADVVLDQFAFGTFGTTAPEAMACGRPVVMAFDRRLHEWCFPVHPPIVDARDERDVADALRRLLSDPSERERLGAAGRVWVERHHGWRLVAKRHLAVYEEVLGSASNAADGVTGVV